MNQLQKTERTTLTRSPKRGSYDKASILEILKEGLVCHISFTDNGQVYLLPNLYGVKNDKIYIHGSVGSFMLRSLKTEIDLCFSVTLIDGLVLARSAFHHSVNYRSVIVFGKATIVTDEEERMEALQVLTEHIVPGRWKEVRLPNKSEMTKTMILSIPLEEASAKIRSGGPNDEEEDYNFKTWAGVLPLKIEAGSPIPDARLLDGVNVPGYVNNYNRDNAVI